MCIVTACPGGPRSQMGPVSSDRVTTSRSGDVDEFDKNQPTRFLGHSCHERQGPTDGGVVTAADVRAYGDQKDLREAAAKAPTFSDHALAVGSGLGAAYNNPLGSTQT